MRFYVCLFTHSEWVGGVFHRIYIGQGCSCLLEAVRRRPAGPVISTRVSPIKIKNMLNQCFIVEWRRSRGLVEEWRLSEEGVEIEWRRSGG